MGRFLNADVVFDTDAGLQGHNILIYCGNSPFNRIDVSGRASYDCVRDDDALDGEYVKNDGGGGYYFDAQQAILDGNFSGTYSYSIPQKAWDVLNYLKGNNMHPIQNYKGGKIFANDGRDNSQMLPGDGITYREYDIDPKIHGVKRTAERIVVGNNGTAWYTPDHYFSFIRME